MKIKKVLCAVMACSIVLSASAFAAGTKENTKLSDGSGSNRGQTNDILFDDFTSAEEGAFPAGWSIANNNGEITTEKVDTGAYGKKNCLLLIDKTSDASWGGPTAKLSVGNLNTGIVGFEVRLKYTPDESSAYTVLNILLQNAAGANVVSSFTPSAGGSFVVRNTSSSSVPLMPIETDTWYTIKYFVDFDNGRYDALMTNETTGAIASQLNLEFATDTDKDTITTFTTLSECYGGTYTYDYVRVTKEESRLNSVLDDLTANIEKGVPAEMIDGPVSHAIGSKINIKVDDIYMATTEEPRLSGEEVLVTAKNIANMFNMVYVRNDEGFTLKNDEVEFSFGPDGSPSGAQLSAAPEVDGVQLFVPIKDIVTAMGYSYSFDSANNVVNISTDGGGTEPTSEESGGESAEETAETENSEEEAE